MVLDGDEKALIMASAVLGTILITLVIFAALYKSFISEYSSTYERQMSLVQRSLDPNDPNKEGDPIVRTSPTFMSRDTESASPDTVMQTTQVAPPFIAAAPPAPKPATPPPPPQPKAKVSFQTPAKPVPPPQQMNDPVTVEADVWGNTEPTATAASWETEDAGNEFFSADEQARIWQELREAEEKAAGGGPTAADQAASQAHRAKSAGIEADEDTVFGFGESELYVAPPVAEGDYIAPDTLHATGEVFDRTAGANANATKMSTMKQATRGVNNQDAEWWN